MGKGKKVLLYGTVILGSLAVFALLVTAFVMLIGSILVRKADEIFIDAGERWCSVSPEINLVGSEEGVVNGYIIIDGEKVQLNFHTKSGEAHLWIKNKNDTDETFFLKGDIKKDSNDRLVIKKIKYINEIDLGVKEIVLHKTGDG